jgi:hypothetical protein
VAAAVVIAVAVMTAVEVVVAMIAAVAAVAVVTTVVAVVVAAAVVKTPFDKKLIQAPGAIWCQGLFLAHYHFENFRSIGT